MNYFGEASGNERSGGSSSSSRKGKKSNSDKPKQPQRGLGVAQLEKIRLHSQMGILPTPPFPTTNVLTPQEDIRIQTAYSSSSSLSYASPSTASYNPLQGHQSIMMGMGELDRSKIMYAESQLSSNPRWNAGSMVEAQDYAQPGITRHLFNLEVEEDLLRKKKSKDQSDSMGSGSQNSDSNGSQELDLELRLAL